MLPPGHMAAGYLVTKILISATHPAISHHQINQLLLWGTLFAFLPDLDMFYSFKKAKGFTIQDNSIEHRDYFTHAPLLWLSIGLIIIFLSQNTFIKYLGLIFWLSSWSHFILDSINGDIRWLYPFSQKSYSLSHIKSKPINHPQKFFPYWSEYLKGYVINSQLTFLLEIILIFAALMICLAG